MKVSVSTGVSQIENLFQKYVQCINWGNTHCKTVFGVFCDLPVSNFFFIFFPFIYCFKFLITLYHFLYLFIGENHIYSKNYVE